MDFYPVIVCGTPEFAVPSLRALAADKRFRVTLVVTQPDKPRGRDRALTPPPMKAAAEALGLPVFQPAKPNLELIPYLEQHGIGRPDFLAVVAYGALLSQQLLDLPTIAPVNVHASLLPRWRGASPVEHSILAGDMETGVTVQRMVKELDAGPILAVAPYPIGVRETSASLLKKLAPIGAKLLVDTLSLPLAETPQPADGITVCGKLTREDAFADPATMTADEIDRRVRALHPRPGAVVTIDGQELKLLETSLQPTDDSAPLPCADATTLHLVSVQPAGKQAMTGAAWARGRR